MNTKVQFSGGRGSLRMGGGGGGAASTGECSTACLPEVVPPPRNATASSLHCCTGVRFVFLLRLLAQNVRCREGSDQPRSTPRSVRTELGAQDRSGPGRLPGN